MGRTICTVVKKVDKEDPSQTVCYIKKYSTKRQKQQTQTVPRKLSKKEKRELYFTHILPFRRFRAD